MYKTVQTGANNQDGGLNTGFIKVGNHVLMEDCVANPDKNPTVKQTITAVIPFVSVMFFKKIFFSCYWDVCKNIIINRQNNVIL